MPDLSHALPRAASIGRHVARVLDPSSLKHKSMLLLFRYLSEKSWIVAPASTVLEEPAIYFPEDVERVTSVPEDTTFLREIDRIKGGKRELPATKANMLTNVELNGCFLRRGQWRQRILRDSNANPADWPTVSIHEAALACTYYGGHFFGDWIKADLTIALAASKFGEPVVAMRPLFTQEPEYRRLFDMQASMIAFGRFGRFVILDDAAQNEYKAERYQTLRDRLSAACRIPNVKKRFYVRRGQSGSPRKLLNVDEIESWLESQGFLIIDPDVQSPSEIARLTNGAELAIGVEGSHMVHAFLNLANRGTFCVIQPPYRFNSPYKNRTSCLGMRYAFAVGFEAEGGFVMPLDHLERFLELVEKQTGLSSSV